MSAQRILVPGPRSLRHALDPGVAAGRARLVLTLTDQFGNQRTARRRIRI